MFLRRSGRLRQVLRSLCFSQRILRLSQRGLCPCLALNAEELAQRTEEDPYIAVFEVAAEANTINYKLAMDYFQYVISTAIGGEAEFIDAYNRILTSIPPIENSLESMIHETKPDLNVVVIVMNDSFSTEVAAVIDNGEIIYDVVNGVGTAPKDITPIIVPKELSPEMQAELDEFKNSLNADNG